MKLKYLSENYEKLFDTRILVCGWVQTVRAQKDLTFIKLNDGSNATGVQLLVDSNIEERIGNTEEINIGSSLRVTGLVVRSPAQGQPYEIQVKKLEVLGLAPISEYPLSKGKLPLDYLRNYAHLRTRTQTFGSVFRIKSGILNATHEFFKLNGYLHVNPNIITVNECEGGAGVFQITEHDMSNHDKLPSLKDSTKHDWNRDHFTRPAYLTVSSQLQLEALSCALGSVYTTNKSFRSEHSTTNKHLSEFEHLEIEDAFINLDELMDIGEAYIKFVSKYLLNNCKEDIENLDKFVSKGLINRINTITNATFKRIKYSEAIDILKKASTLSQPVVYGEDLCSEFENYLTEYFSGPVFVSHWPIAIKSFYMKQCADGSGLCENFDLLMPYRVGELIGGSMREDNLDAMLNIMKSKGVNPEPLEFYLDLRRFGSVPHGGFGLGLDRMCMMFTGMESIKDVVAFPVYFRNCAY
jgi:asparaginyl-tRNA synthetase